MKIPSDTSFLFVCAQHNIPLKGVPFMTHPNLEARAVWVFDTSGMYCEQGNNEESDKANNCQLTWEVRA